ncbi:hypothetical protein VF21_06136 [Pseudogymnoascus sp. 05NY08]|nr:hypothetical protein VF21_06136 [Pseudogymnoascus sp. 05NY08]
MSGAEFLAVISSIITIVDATKKVYDAASSTDGIHEAFREVAGRLPIVMNTLSSAKQCIDEGDVDENTCKGVKHVIDACEIKARKLNELFRKTIPADGAPDFKRYYRAVKTYRKGNEVKNLMKGMLEDIQLLACEHGLKTATSVQRDQVSKAIEEVLAIPSSVPDQALQETGFTANKYGPGTQTNYSAQGENIAQGQARQYNSTGTMNIAQTSFYSITQNVPILQDVKEAEVKACLAALFLTNPRVDRENLVDEKGPRVHSTCEWIKTNELYTSWLHSRSQLLWLSGGPGKGKTMISIFLAEELEQTATDIRDTLFLQYFCHNKDDERNTGVAVIRGLLFQLLQLQPTLIDYILPSFEVQKASLLTFGTLWRIFETMIRDTTLGTVYCIIDGLDECEETSLLVLLRKLKALFSIGFSESSTHCLNLIVVSRDYPNIISEMLSSFPCIQLDTHANMEVNTDVRRFIKVKVNELSMTKNYPRSLCAHVEEVFANRANGTFLWVGIVAKELTKYTWTEVEEVLQDHFPPGLEELYARMLLQIRPGRRRTAAKILLWVTLAVRPLSLLELSAALEIAVEPSASFRRDEVMRDKVSHCGNFLIVKKDEVGLIHQSAKDYLLRKIRDLNPELEFFRVKEEVGNREITRKCLDYLQNGALASGKVDLSTNSPDLKAFPLLLYAALHWPQHARSLVGSKDISNPSYTFYHENSLSRESWLKSYWAAIEDERPPHLFTPLHLASCFGILPLAENLLCKKGLVGRESLRFILNKRDSRGRTALWWAAANGYKDVAQLLLNKGADTETEGEIESGHRMTALSVAVMNEHDAVVQLLLERGANVNAKGEIEGWSKMTPLNLAVLYRGETMVQLLLKNGADIHAKVEKGGKLTLTVLYLAVIGGDEAVVRLLLNNGALVEEKIELECGSKSTALSAAIAYRHSAMVQLLLEKGADIDAKVKLKDGLTATALFIAAAHGHEDMVQLLLENGAKWRAKTPE